MALVVKHPPSIPGSGRSAGGGPGHPLQCSSLENAVARGACGLQSEGLTESDLTGRDLAYTRTHAEAGTLSARVTGPGRKQAQGRGGLGCPPASWLAAVPCGRTGVPTPRVCRSVSRARGGTAGSFALQVRVDPGAS